MTSGTRNVASRSVSSRIGTFAPCACSTSLMICDSMVSRPRPATSICSSPFLLMVPAATFAPGRFSIGMLSPVSIDSSTADTPTFTTPSTGMRSPGLTSTMSP